MPKLSKLFKLAGDPRTWKVVAHGVLPGVEHRSAFAHLPRHIDLIVDVGANKGQFASAALIEWPAAEIICYEPLARERSKLAAVLAGFGRPSSSIRPRALGATQTSAAMNISSRRDSSSLLRQTDLQTEVFGTRDVASEPVPVTRLDEDLDIDSEAINVLKIDVQGYEYDVLVGASNVLSKFKYIYVECSYQELYRGQKLLEEVVGLLGGHEFEKVAELNLESRNGTRIQSDILFERKSVGAALFA